MNPALLTLARQLAALPGFPPRDMISDELCCRGEGGIHLGWRDRTGVLWRPDTEAERPAPWLHDLADPATGGVLLNLVPPRARWRITIGDDGSFTTNVGASIREVAYDVNCSTLAEASARVLVTLGRAG